MKATVWGIVMPIRDLTLNETKRLLSMEEVMNLPDGTEVMVKWSGGNGPHKYLIKRDKWGNLGVIAHDVWHYLDYVGKDHIQTSVFLAG